MVLDGIPVFAGCGSPLPHCQAAPLSAKFQQLLRQFGNEQVGADKKTHRTGESTGIAQGTVFQADRSLRGGLCREHRRGHFRVDGGVHGGDLCNFLPCCHLASRISTTPDFPEAA
jgi:hypothetical protein